MVHLSHLHMTTEKTISFDYTDLVSKVMSLLLNMLSRVVSFPSKEQVSFNFMAAVTICSDFGPQENSLSLLPLFHLLFAFK